MTLTASIDTIIKYHHQGFDGHTRFEDLILGYGGNGLTDGCSLRLCTTKDVNKINIKFYNRHSIDYACEHS